MNHCGVLRKITGFFERQLWGYWCLSRPRATARRLDQGIDDRLVRIAHLALVGDDALALEAGRFFSKAPFSSTV